MGVQQAAFAYAIDFISEKLNITKEKAEAKLLFYIMLRYSELFKKGE